MTASFDHEVTGTISVEFGHGFEQVKEICTVDFVQCGDEAGVDEDNLGAETGFFSFCKLREPGLRMVSMGEELGEDLVGYVRGVGWVRVGFASA